MAEIEADHVAHEKKPFKVNNDELSSRKASSTISSPVLFAKASM